MTERTNKAAGKRAQRSELLLFCFSLVRAPPFDSPVVGDTAESLRQCRHRIWSTSSGLRRRMIAMH